MNFFKRLSNGWNIGKTSLSIINKNRSLLLFPFISGLAMIFISVTYFGGTYAMFSDQFRAFADDNVSATNGEAMVYLIFFIFYIISYFVVFFFNVGLVHCSRKILEGNETSFSEGINHATKRIVTIISWALLAATVGTILKLIQERSRGFGKLIVGVFGIVWSIATFFVAPVIAYEDVNPFQAIKRSGSIMKKKWGETLGANFSFGVFSFIGLICIVIPISIAFSFIHLIMGLFAGIITFTLLQIIITSANMVFITAAYQNINNNPIGQFDPNILDSLFYNK